jgi:hypothetical protein
MRFFLQNLPTIFFQEDPLREYDDSSAGGRNKISVVDKILTHSQEK